MTENAKTIAFVAVGLVAVAIGLVTRPKAAVVDDSSLVGQDLTKLASTDEAKRLRIVRFDEDEAAHSNFEVAEQNGLWSIPSKKDYPADAVRQMAEAATSLMDRKILAVATKSAGDHEEYGVIDPLSPKLEAGQKGVGTRVTMSDVHNEPIVDLIVGKAVKNAEGQRYVREAGRDIVYVIEIDSSKLSTNFEDWIEKDLLKLNSWDLQQVEIKDYSAELVQGMTPDGQFAIAIDQDRRAQMIFAYHEVPQAKWEAVKLQQFDPKAGENGQYVDFTLAEDEELNEEKLNGLKTALQDLKIVDVARKPAGLSEELKAGDDFLKNREMRLELMLKGFTAAPGQDSGPGELISSDGEVIATMKDGTEYVLRFGNLTNAGTTGEQAGEAAAATETDQKPADGSDVNRYLFVMARFNESAVKQPELEKLPELPAGADESTEEKASEPASSETPDGEPASAAGQSSEPNTTNPDSSEPTSTEPAASATDATEGNGGESAATDAGSQTPTASDEESRAASENQPEATSSDAAAPTSSETPANADSADAAAAAASQEGDNTKNASEAANDEKAKVVEKTIAERKRIEQENQRKLDQYQESLKKGRDNVKELNLRFGDWYFVVPDDVFKKVRLGRNDVVKKKEKKDAGDATTDGAVEAATGEAAAATAIPGLPPIPETGAEE
jgi:Domain of unknown function (DUF4340)